MSFEQATAICCGFSHEEIMSYVSEMAHWYRTPNGGFGKLEAEMRKRFYDILPEDAMEKISGRLTISILPLDPRNMLNQKMVSDFQSTDDLVEAVLTSSFIPLYLAPTFAKRYRNEWCVDGGIGNAVPFYEGSISICPLPGTGKAATNKFHPARLIASDVHITPDLLKNDKSFTIPAYPKVLRRALIPGTDEELWTQFELGVASAKVWAESGSA